MLDRLVRRPVLAEVDAVVREDEERLQVRERREADRRAHVVAEDEERRAERDEAVARRAMPFTNAPMACSRMPKWMLRPSNLPLAMRRRAFDVRLRRGVEIGRAADERRHERRDAAAR